MRRVNLQVDRTPVDSLVASSNSSSLRLNLPTNLGKVVEPSVGLVKELSEFYRLWRRSITGRLGRRFGFVFIAGDVDQLKNERTTSDNSGTARKEIPSDDVLEY